ncbi:MAG: aminopeptidase N [Myxococcota bacterium]
MKETSPITIRRADYSPPAFLVDDIHLRFELDATRTKVTATSSVRRSPQAAPDAPLVLNGVALRLLSVSINDQRRDDARVDGEDLIVGSVPDRFQLVVETEIDPTENKSGEGLYLSGGTYCTQCEAQGFRRMTYFPDRPDVMSRYRTTLVADKSAAPVLLSNGNLVDSGDLDGGRHLATWEDPHKKPSYLFALVAGRLERLDGTFTTMGGREVALHVYLEPGNLDQAGHCMESLIKSMKWDEETFGREYDLDVFMIVAVGFFNMGAMENKGLNIFNTRYVLARPDTATDADFQGVEGVVAHEYFHNWSGNRVTCRDWFQLSLKEGFTVFRDQEFSSDVGSRAIKRIEDVQRLRAAQFREDAGPTAHPIRPDSYQEISNFYTPTVYEKGAEVVRMAHTLLGPEAFRRGCDLYFERHDGQAVTCDDFVTALEDASERDLSHFRLWYAQAGTPVVTARTQHDAERQTFSITLRQHTDQTPGQLKKKPLHVPVRVGLIDTSGNDLPLTIDGAAVGTDALLELREEEQTFVFESIAQRPVASLFRGFSAPIKLRAEEPESDALFRMAHDSDPFNRWEAAQQLSMALLLAAVREQQPDRGPFIDAFGTALSADDADPALLSHALSLPDEALLAAEMDPVDVEGLHAERESLRAALREAHRDAMLRRYESLTDAGPYSKHPAAIGRRSLRNTLLGYLSAGDDDLSLAAEQFDTATNMTDSIKALSLLANADAEESAQSALRERCLSSFYARWQHEALVIDKWFAIQALSMRSGCLADVMALMDHEKFDIENPNRVRALVGAFGSNHLHFHSSDGSGYRFQAQRIIEIDAFNPQVAARLIGSLAHWRRHGEQRQELMKRELGLLLDRPDVSRDVFEIATKTLA